MKIETLAVHAGYEPDPTTKAVAVPIYQTTSYAFDSTQHGADLFDLKVEGNIYSRIMNPTTAVLEQRVTEMEGGLAALGLSSGQAATTYSLLTIAEAGDNFISTSTLYGGTYNLFAHTFPQIGIDARFADPEDIDGMAALIDDRTKAIYCESLGNPAGNIIDLQALSDMAHAHGVPVIVDNTVPSPYLNNPFKWGCDIIVHSLTKYMGGHGTIIGGVLVDSGKFDWVANKDRFRRLNEPDVSYHGVVFTEALAEAAYIGRARVVPLRNMGSAISAMTSFLALQGIETLPLRMERHIDSTQKVVEFLASHPFVSRVGHPLIESHPSHALAQKLLRHGARGAGAVFSFDIKGSRAQGKAFIEALKLFSHLANVGDCRSLVIHPASTTHFRMTDEALAGAGISQGTIRLSIGLEDPADLIDDLKRALKAAEKAGA